MEYEGAVPPAPHVRTASQPSLPRKQADPHRSSPPPRQTVTTFLVISSCFPAGNNCLQKNLINSNNKRNQVKITLNNHIRAAVGRRERRLVGGSYCSLGSQTRWVWASRNPWFVGSSLHISIFDRRVDAPTVKPCNAKRPAYSG